MGSKINLIFEKEVNCIRTLQGEFHLFTEGLSILMSTIGLCLLLFKEVS